MSWEYDPVEWYEKEMVDGPPTQHIDDILLADARQLSLLDGDGLAGAWEELPLWFQIKHGDRAIRDILTAIHMVFEENK